MHWARKVAVSCAAAAIAGGLSLTFVPEAHAESSTYKIAWTGVGLYPRAAPSLDAAIAGEALPDGASVQIKCELTGQPVSNGAWTTSIWEQLTNGQYVPNAHINTGVDGWTPGVPKCDAPSPTRVTETPKRYEGIRIAPHDVSRQLINHYYDGTGDAAVIDWSYFTGDAKLMKTLKKLPNPDGYDSYNSNPSDDGDIYYALGSFTIARTSEHCFVIKDTYDFAPDKVENVPYIFNWTDARLGKAKEFTTYASGCVTS